MKSTSGGNDEYSTDYRMVFAWLWFIRKSFQYNSASQSGWTFVGSGYGYHAIFYLGGKHVAV